VPYAWKFKVLFHQFEMIWAANQHNWIDCSTKHQENGRKQAYVLGLYQDIKVGNRSMCWVYSRVEW
jgi:hypothetical protein